MHNYGKFLTPTEIADRLRVQLDIVYRWITAGDLPATNVTRNGRGQKNRWRISESDLEVFLAERGSYARRETKKRQKSAVSGNVTKFF